MTAALHVLQLKLSPPPPSSLAPMKSRMGTLQVHPKKWPQNGEKDIYTIYFSNNKLRLGKTEHPWVNMARYDLRKFFFTNRVVNIWNSLPSLPDYVVFFFFQYKRQLCCRVLISRCGCCSSLIFLIEVPDSGDKGLLVETVVL